MREIANSQAYQLSSRYNGTWNPAWQTLFARKMVRRLWSEEVHDSITQSSGVIPTYNMGAVYGTASWAMQIPEPLNLPDGGNGAVNNFLNAFLRGNRDDQQRKGDGSISQALDLMNDNFVMNRVQYSKAPKAGLLAQVAGHAERSSREHALPECVVPLSQQYRDDHRHGPPGQYRHPQPRARKSALVAI